MTEQAKVPAIRFAGFTDPWEQRKLGDIAENHRAFADHRVLDRSIRSDIMRRHRRIRGIDLLCRPKAYFVNIDPGILRFQ